MRLVSAAACAVMLSCLDVLPGSLFVVVVAMAPAAAQQGDLAAILKRFNALYGAGDYPAALAEAQKVEAGVKARFGVNHPRYAAALDLLAVVYDDLGRYAEAEGLYQRALAIQEKVLGASHPDVAPTLHSLAGVYLEQSKYAE